MKTQILLACVVFFASFSFGQVTEEQVRIYLPDSTRYELINAAELMGDWKNVSYNLPMAMAKVEKEFPSTNGQLAFFINGRVTIKDQVLEKSYPNNLKNILWRIENARLYLISSDLGKREVEVKWDSSKKEFKLTIDHISYAKFGDYANFYK